MPKQVKAYINLRLSTISGEHQVLTIECIPWILNGHPVYP